MRNERVVTCFVFNSLSDSLFGHRCILVEGGERHGLRGQRNGADGSGGGRRHGGHRDGRAHGGDATAEANISFHFKRYYSSVLMI